MSRRSAPKTEPERKRRRGRPPGRETEEMKASFGDARVIKRYGNRRLYDHKLSRSVTLQEVGDFVRNGEHVVVVDAATGRDITKRVLIQILLEEQNARVLELVPVDLLRKMIALRDDTLSDWLEQYLYVGSQWLERAADNPSARTDRKSVV